MGTAQKIWYAFSRIRRLSGATSPSARDRGTNRVLLAIGTGGVQTLFAGTRKEKYYYSLPTTGIGILQSLFGR